MVKVVKAGGAPLGSAGKIQHFIDDIVLADQKRRIVVPSAIEGMTDMLLRIARQSHESRSVIGLEEAIERFEGVRKGLGIGGEVLEPLYAELQEALEDFDSPEAQYTDGAVVYGERINGVTLVEAISRSGRDAALYYPENGFLTDSRHGNGQLYASSYRRLRSHLNELLDDGKIIVVPGFHGADKKGNFVTFKRGGTEFTMAVVANAIDAALCEIFKDVRGVYRAHPGIVPNAEVTRRMSYDELEESGVLGTKVFQFDGVIPLRRKGISLRIRSADKLDDEGTLVNGNGDRRYDGIATIAYNDRANYAELRVKKSGISDITGYGETLFRIVRQAGISYLNYYDSVNTINIYFANTSGEQMEDLAGRIKKSRILSPDSIEVNPNVTVIGIVGEMFNQRVVSIISDIFAKHFIHPRGFAQGSDRSMIYVLNPDEGPHAVRALHDGLYAAGQFRQAC